MQTSRPWTWSALGMALLVAAGCSSTTAPPMVPAPEPKKEQKSDADTPITSTPAAAEKSGETQIAADPASSPTASPEKSAKATPTDPPAAPPATAAADAPADDAKAGGGADAIAGPAQPASAAPATTVSRDEMIRVIAFAPAGPLVIDIAVLLDGQPLGKARNDAVDRIFRAIDEDQDGRITWEQFARHPRIMSGLYGNSPIAEGASLKELLERYDIVKNDRVDREELPRFFSDDRGATKAFSLLAPARPVGAPGEDSILLAWLDADGDGQLSAEERAEARAQLRIRDADDDRVLSASELAPQMDARMAGMMPMRRPATGPPSGMLLGPNPRWEALSYHFQEIYSGVGRPLRTGHFSGTPQLAERIDGNKDGRISTIELQNLENAPADLVLTLSYVSQAGGESAPPKLEASPLANDWAPYQATWKQEGLRAQFKADEYTITLVMADLVGASGEMEAAKLLFAQADADKNGYLEEKEFNLPQILPGLNFTQADENKDGKIYLEEVASLAAQRRIVAGSQAVIKLEAEGDPFLHVLDQDGDGQLSHREIREAEMQLAQLDKDGDGLVGIGELPQSMRISVIRGIVDQNTVIPETPRTMAAASSGAAPLWFTKMDANGDGEISEIEFLGTAEQFAAFDKDGDGAIAAAEAAEAAPAESTGATAAATTP